jgi:hypothetical protein
MGKLEFDFREGLDKDHIVYRKKGFDFKHCMYYIGYLLFTWGYTVAFFALFQFAYTNHEEVAFPIYIALWLLFMIVLTTIAVINLVKAHRNKEIKRAKKQAELHGVQHHGVENMPTNHDGKGIELTAKGREEKDQLVQ